MTTSLRRAFAAIAAILASVIAIGTATAQDTSKYPTQPIRVIVPFAPGGASDFVARLIQPGLTQFLGQQVVVENRAGAAGNVGMDVAARGRARRLHHLPRQRRHHLDQSEPVPRHHRQAREGLHPGLDRCRHARHPDRQPQVPAQQCQGARRVRQGEPGQDQLRLARQRQPQSPGDGGLPPQRRPRHEPRALQGRRRSGGGRHHGRPRRADVHHHLLGHPAREGRAPQGAGRHHQGARAGAARRADHARAGLPGQRQQLLAGRAGARGHAAADRRQAPRRARPRRWRTPRSWSAWPRPA